MADIIIYHSDGEPLIARATIIKAEQSVKLLGEDVINVEVGSKNVVPFSIGDYIEWCGKTYTLNQLPSVHKNTSVDFNYPTVTFEGEQYELLDSAWLLPTNTYGDSFTGDLKDFLDILIENTERSGRAWQLGTYPAETDYKTLTYTETNCLNVLQNICQEWKVEFEIKRQGATRVLNIKDKIGDEFPTRFEYGRTGGAYKIERNTVSNQNIITRLFVFGGDKNLPCTYRNPKLCLPGKNRNESYISNAQSVAMYGIRENVKTFPEIFPARYGTVTAVDGEDKKNFYDSTMDFDLNERDENGTKWLIPSTVAKIQFNSGGLAGYTFEISEYNHATKKFKIKTYTDANGLQFPNPDSAAFQIAIGDEYFISDIRVPQSYIDVAETKLKTEGEKYFEENCSTHVNYAISISPLFLKHLYGDTKLTYEIFKVGDTIEIYDLDLEISKKLRIAGFTRNLLNPYEFTLTIAENVEIQTQFQRIIRELTDIKSVIYQNDITSADNARRNWLATQDVINSVFDTEGQYYSEKIKPLSIETSMLAVGARSQQFVLKDVNFEPNYQGNANQIKNTAGTLEHYTIDDTGVRVWNITSGSTTLALCNHEDGEGHTHIHGASVNQTVFHIYAKCSRSGDNGFILFDCAEHTLESDPQFYHFLVGTLTSVITDGNGQRAARNIALTYGSSSINGRFINTGRIQSKDGSTYIDLDQNIIKGRFNFTDGIISDRVFVGKTEKTAIAGLGGYDSSKGANNVLWAGKNGSNYRFQILDNGTLYIRDKYNKYICYTDQSSGKFIISKLWCTEDAYFQGATFQKNISAYGYIKTNNGIYSDNEIVVGSKGRMLQKLYFENGEYTHGIVPSLIYIGRWIYQKSIGLKYCNPESGGINGNKDYIPSGGGLVINGLGITVTRYKEGCYDFKFNRKPKFQWFVTALGCGEGDLKKEHGFISVQRYPTSRNDASGFLLTIADDHTPNDYPFEIQIWAYPNDRSEYAKNNIVN